MSSIAPRIIRRGVAPTAPAQPAPSTPAADLAAELADDSQVVEVNAPESEGSEDAPIETAPETEQESVEASAPAAPAAKKVNVAAALDKAAKEDSKKLSPLPKKVTINRGQKEDKVPEEGSRITRDFFFRWFQEKLGSFEEMDFSGITLAQARRFWEFLEKGIRTEIIEKFEISLFEMLFKHRNTKGSFREPKDIIFYNGPRLEIMARRIFPGIEAALKIENDSIKVGHMKEGQLVEDPELAKTVIPAYLKHLEKTSNRLEADDVKAAARASKIQDRTANLLSKYKK